MKIVKEWIYKLAHSNDLQGDLDQLESVIDDFHSKSKHSEAHLLKKIQNKHENNNLSYDNKVKKFVERLLKL